MPTTPYMPQVPRYRMPGFVGGQAEPYMERASKFYEQNPYQGDPYAAFTGQMGKYGQGLMGQANQNPLLTGDYLKGGPQGWMSQFGAQYPGPNDPIVPEYMANLRGGTQNLLNQFTNRAANAGVAAGRGGMGIAGGVDPRSAMMAQGTQQLAGQYGTDYAQAMDWAAKRANFMYGGAQDWLRTAGDIYGKQLGAAGGMFGQQFAGLQAGRGDYNDYMNRAGAAYGTDVNSYNTWLQNQPGYINQMKQTQQGQNQAQTQQDQQKAYQDQWNQMFGSKSYATNPQWGMGLNQGGMNELLGQRMGYMQPVQRSMQYKSMM
jgi:hypothetical protein